MRAGNDVNAYHAAYKGYPPLDGATGRNVSLTSDGGHVHTNGVYKMRHNGNHNPSMAGVVASYGVYQHAPQDYGNEQDDDEHGFADSNFRGNGNGSGGGGGSVAGGGRGVVVNATGGASVVDQQRHCPNNTSPATTSPEGWMTCCRPIVLLLTLVLLIIVFVLVSGALLYINYVAYKPRQSYVEEPCEKTFCAWGAQCVTGPDGSARCQCPTHCRPHAEQPVCGGDGRTYESHCHLRMAACRARLNVRVLHDGKCGHADPCKERQCSFGARCLPTPDGKNVTCQCPTKCPNYGDHTASRPVCGSDGQDYENQCEMRRAACHAEVNITIRFLGKCDPCEGVACQPPAVCQLDERRHPACRCDENCPRNFDPVCGSDGKTYTNECSLRQEACRENKNLAVVYRGKCSSGINPCGSVKCTLGEFCTIDKFGIARCECPSQCPLVLKPVCSKDGRTYGSECEMLREACLTRVPLDVNYVGVCGAGSPCHGSNNGCRYGAVCVVRGEDSLCECPKCSNVFEPVCGSDGVTYVNECVLKREGCLAKTDVQVAYVGTCDECLHKQCDHYSVCQSDESPEDAGAQCVCPQSCDLFDDLKLRSNETVCGSNGVTYAHECALRIAACGAAQNIMVAYKGDCDLCSGVECKHGGHCAAGECVCPSRCDDAGDEPVCASNLTTFRNECELQKAACPQISTPSLPATLETIRGTQSLTVLFYGDCRERFPVPGTFTTDASTIQGNGQTGITGHILENPSGTEVSINTDPTSMPVDGCKDIQCDFEATCELGADNFPRCTCQFDCSLATQDIDPKPVCASNMRIYPSLCAMKMEACQNQAELRLRPLDLCQGMEVKPCNGDKPLLDAITNKELDCGNGPLRQDCPSGSYCHQTTRFARCCLKDQSFLHTTCETSWFGCCPDGKTPAQGPEQLGCPLMCGCNKLGAYSEACDPVTNGCKCRPGVGGEKCDRCEPGYWGLPKISSGHHGCIPCGCSAFGSVRDDCEQMTGRCVCKSGVQGQKCTECASTAKILTNSGCLTPDAAKQPVTSCKDMTCHYGAVCMERNHFVFCECPADTVCQEDQPDPTNAETEIVCGSDGQTYPSACTLRKVACKLQKDIVVQSFGHCKNSDVYGSGTDWPVKHYTPLQFTQSDDANSPLSKSTRHLLHIQKYPYPKYDNNIHSHTRQAFRPTPATVRVFTALLGDLCAVALDCPILYSYCIRGACTCLPEYSESPDRQECIRSLEIPTDQQEIPQMSKKYETPLFNGLSYIKLKPLKAYHKLSIEIEFKTYTQDGILFYNHQFLDSSGDFISLAIRNGFVEFRYNLGDGPVVITSLEKVTIGKFHRVVAKRYHRDGMLQLDDGENVAGQSEGKLRALDLIEDAYLGGMPLEYQTNTRVYENIGFTLSFQGCIKHLKINRKSVELYEGFDDILQTKNIYECSSYNHTNLPNLETDIFTSSKTLENFEYVPEFNGISFLIYPSLKSTNFDIEITFLSKVKNGLILYNGQLKNGRGDFVCLSLVRGYLQFRFNLGSGIANITTKDVITLGRWHSVKITRSGRHGTLQLDNGTISTGYSGLPLAELNLGLPLYIGSMMKWTEIHKLAGAASGFKGAIQQMYINNAQMNMSLTDCASHNGAVKLAGVKECGYKIARYNGLPCPLKGHPCQNGGRCISQRNSYVCHCPDGYEGLQCDILTSKTHPIKLSGDMFLTYRDPFVRRNLSLELSSAARKNHSEGASFAKKYPFIIEVNQAGENDDDAENENDTKFYEQSGATAHHRSKSERGTRYEFRLRAAAPDGLLLWRFADEDYFSIAVVGGYPELSFNLADRDDKRHFAIRSLTTIDDSQWHTLHVRQKDRRCSIQVDKGITQEEILKEDTFTNLTSLIFLGGAPSLPPDLPTEYYQSFQGCIDYMSINSLPVNLHLPLEHVSSLQNTTIQYCNNSRK